MSQIIAARAFLVDIPVETLRTDAMQSFVKQETIFVELSTDDGLTGLGYSYTIGTGGRAVLSMLTDHLLADVIGADCARPEAIWQAALGTTRATAVGAITSLALAALDTAVWDVRAKAAGLPLWQLAGGHCEQVKLYDTEGGWLHIDTDALVAGAEVSRAAGWHGVKVKVGKPHVAEDVERLRAVRAAIGDQMDLMVDANQAFSRAEAVRRAAAYEHVDLAWFEEPMPADDVIGHQYLASHTTIPVAVGETMYSIGQFAEYLMRGAASVIQVDVARIGGITPWLKVAHLAEACNVRVCPHFLMELHVSLAAAVSNGGYVEHIPQLRGITRTEMEIIDGFAVAPSSPGLGIDWDLDAIDRQRVI